MSNTAFSAASVNPLTAQPAGAGEKLIVRSTSAADTMNCDVYGLVAGVASSNTLALLGMREVLSTNLFTSLTQARLASAAAGTVRVFGQGTAATGDIRCDTNPADGDTLTLGLTGFTQVYRFKTTTAAAYDVKIGATAADSMSNLKKALNADGVGDGTDYHTGTAANPYLSATVATAVVSLTDRLAVARQLAWSFAQSASKFTIRTMAGGVMGTQLAKLNPGVTLSHNDLTFSAEAHTGTNLPGLLTLTSKSIRCNGSPVSLRFWANHTLTLNYETSSDNTNWHPGITTIGASGVISASTLTWAHTAESVDYIRLNITAHASTTDTIFDARVIYR